MKRAVGSSDAGPKVTVLTSMVAEVSGLPAMGGDAAARSMEVALDSSGQLHLQDRRLSLVVRPPSAVSEPVVDPERLAYSLVAEGYRQALSVQGLVTADRELLGRAYRAACAVAGHAPLAQAPGPLSRSGQTLA